MVCDPDVYCQRHKHSPRFHPQTVPPVLEDDARSVLTNTHQRPIPNAYLPPPITQHDAGGGYVPMEQFNDLLARVQALEDRLEEHRDGVLQERQEYDRRPTHHRTVTTVVRSRSATLQRSPSDVSEDLCIICYERPATRRCRGGCERMIVCDEQCMPELARVAHEPSGNGVVRCPQCRHPAWTWSADDAVGEDGGGGAGAAAGRPTCGGRGGRGGRGRGRRRGSGRGFL